MHYDVADLDKLSVYRLLTHAVIPRPVAWVLSENEQGSLNIAPFSYFSVVSSDPAMLMISVGHKRDGSQKDTWANIDAREQCVVHIANTAAMASVNETARGLAAGESELTNIDHELVQEKNFQLPRIKAAPVALACRKHDIHLLGEAQQAVIYLAVEQIYVDDNLLAETPYAINAAALDPISRLGAEDYAALGEITTLKRPS